MTLVALLGVVAVLLVVRASRRVDDTVVHAWAEDHSVLLTERTRDAVGNYLRNAATLRMLGVLGGIVVPPMAAWAVGQQGLVFPYDLAWVFVGYLVGALYAEISLGRGSVGETRTASLIPRTPDSYAPRGLLIAQTALGVIGLIGSLLIVLLGLSSKADVSRATVVSLGLIAGLGSLALQFIERRIVERSQPGASPDVLEADNAIRAQSVHSVASSGVAALLLVVSRIAATATSSDFATLNTALLIPVSLMPVIAVGVCLFFGHRPWSMQRRAIGAVRAG